MNRINSGLFSLVAISASESNSTSILSKNTFITGSTIANMTNADQDKQKRPNEAAQIIKNSQVICFDVDSTVITEEGIDELAKFCGKGNEVARLTREAMSGSMTFQDALRLRLNIIRPSQKQIREFNKIHPSPMSKGVKELIQTFHKKGLKVYLVSGGFNCIIEPVAIELGIPLENVFANKLLFGYNGEYAGFDTNQPTCRSGGKGEAIKIIRTALADQAIITMIGDGATDLEASPPANYFIGYGGNIIRDEVRNRAKYYITDFEQITKAF